MRAWSNAARAVNAGLFGVNVVLIGLLLADHALASPRGARRRRVRDVGQRAHQPRPDHVGAAHAHRAPRWDAPPAVVVAGSASCLVARGRRVCGRGVAHEARGRVVHARGAHCGVALDGAALGHPARFAAGLVVLGVGPVALWAIVTRLVSPSGDVRPIGFHPPGWRQFDTAVDTASSWLVGLDTDRAARVAVLSALVVVAVVLAVLIVRERPRVAPGRTPRARRGDQATARDPGVVRGGLPADGRRHQRVPRRVDVARGTIARPRADRGGNPRARPGAPGVGVPGGRDGRGRRGRGGDGLVRVAGAGDRPSPSAASRRSRRSTTASPKRHALRSRMRPRSCRRVPRSRRTSLPSCSSTPAATRSSFLRSSTSSPGRATPTSPPRRANSVASSPRATGTSCCTTTPVPRWRRPPTWPST